MSPVSSSPAPDRRQAMAAAGAVALAGLCAGPARSADEAAANPWTEQGFVQRAGGRIHWASLGASTGPSVGQGEPIVLLHKLGGWIADWRAIAPRLARGRRVIALDLPGHGDSDMLGMPPYAYSVAEGAAMVRTALEDMGLTRYVLIGNSLGGEVAIMMASCWPQNVGKMVLISVALGEPMSRAEVLKEDADTRANYDAQGRPIARSAAQTATFGSIDPRINDEQNLSRAKAGLWVRSSQRGVDLAGMADALPRVAAPTLLMYADRGAYTKFETVGRERLKTVQVVKIADAGSFIQQEKPAEAAAAINAFLA